MMAQSTLQDGGSIILEYLRSVHRVEMRGVHRVEMRITVVDRSLLMPYLVAHEIW